MRRAPCAAIRRESSPPSTTSSAVSPAAQGTRSLLPRSAALARPFRSRRAALAQRARASALGTATGIVTARIVTAHIVTARIVAARIVAARAGASCGATTGARVRERA